MPDAFENQDIQFQPKQQEYSYTTIPKQKIKANIFITLFLGLSGLLLLFLVFLAVLNYFNIISLSTVLPVLKDLPKSPTITQTIKQENEPHNISGTNQFTFDGTLEKYDQNFVYIKFLKKTVTIEYNYDSNFYFSKTLIDTDSATPSSETIAIIDFPSNILSKENIGKKVSVQYSKEKNKNILESLTLNK